MSWKSSKKNKRDGKKKGADLYALLGLKNERFLATPKQIKDGACLMRQQEGDCRMDCCLS